MTKIIENINTNPPPSELQQKLSDFIRARIPRKEDAEDILQDVLLQYSKLQSAEDIQHLSGWLHQVARNKIIDLYRRQSPDYLEEYLLNEEDEEDYYSDGILAIYETPEDIYWREQFWEVLYESLELLPENQRKVFIMNELEGITLREIAAQENENLKTIISRKGYAMRRLRTALIELYENLD